MLFGQKKTILYAGIFFVAILGTFYVRTLQGRGRFLPPTGYVSAFQRNKGQQYREFLAKIDRPMPIWVKNQILTDFDVGKISLVAVEATYEKVLQRPDIGASRYRVVDGKVYRHTGNTKPMGEPEEWWVKGLCTLAALVRLPNVDFLISYEDGIRESFYDVGDLERQAPILVWAKLRSLPFSILIPDYRSVSFLWDNDTRKFVEGKGYLGQRIPWEEKDARGFWRGATTEFLHRKTLVELAQNHPAWVDAGFCSGIDCDSQLYRPAASYEEHLHYKYLPVLDGVMCTYPGYQWRLLSDSVAFKQESDQIQWFYGALTPYVHYVPLQEDLSDFLEKISWARSHDEECQKMRDAATRFSLENLLLPDVYAYFYWVLQEYSIRQEKSFLSEWSKTMHSQDWQIVHGK